MEVRQALAFYYKAALVPLIISVIIAAPFGLLAGTLINSFTHELISTSGYTNIINMAVAVGFVLLYILVLLPLSILVNAAIYHLFANNLFHIWSKPYSNTMTAVLYSVLPVSVIPILPFIWLFMPGLKSISAILVAVGILLFIALGIWEFIVLIISMARQQGVSGWRAFAGILISIVIFGIIVGIIDFVFAIGVFSSTLSNGHVYFTST